MGLGHLYVTCLGEVWTSTRRSLEPVLCRRYEFHVASPAKIGFRVQDNGLPVS